MLGALLQSTYCCSTSQSSLPLLPSVGVEDDMHTHTNGVYLAGLCTYVLTYIHTYTQAHVRTRIRTLGSYSPYCTHTCTYIRRCYSPLTQCVGELHTFHLRIACVSLSVLCDLTGLCILIVLCPIGTYVYYDITLLVRTITVIRKLH